MPAPTSSRSRWPDSLSLRAAVLAAVVAALAACTPMPAAQAPTSAAAGAAPLQRVADGPLPVPSNLVALTQPAGQQRLLRAEARQSYWPLSTQFETQRNEAYCSVATSVMALNALGIQRPMTPQYPDFPYFTQDDFFNSVDPRIASAVAVAHTGMTLDQLGAVLGTFPVTVSKVHASDVTLDQFRRIIRAATAQSGQFALLNFRRAEIGEAGGGHWSPVAAYDAASDSALVLDVARYKYPPVWVPMAQLYQGALAVDNVSGLSRGLLVVGKR